MIWTKIWILHEIQLVDGIDKARVQIGQHIMWIRVLIVIPRRTGRLQFQVIQRQRIRIVIQLVKIAAIQREIRAAEAIIRIGWIICENKVEREIS